MYQRNTVFVIGAGASVEFNLPMGSGLANRISELMRFDFEMGSFRRGDEALFDALRYRFRQNNELNNYLQAARRISDGVLLADSIDRYLHIHAEDSEAIFCGKAAIVRAILEAEQNSLLYVQQNNINSTIDFNRTTDTWIKNFFSILIDGVQKNDLDNIFDGISIICFNYDRCIEHFLIHALAQTYSIDRSEAILLVKKLRIYHPYGTIGELPSQERMGDGLIFGDEFKSRDIELYVQRIKTFTEQIEDPAILHNVKNSIKNARNVIFLGFAYHRQNIELIKPDIGGNINSIFGTAFGISDHGKTQIENTVKTLSGRPVNSIQINNGLKCASFLSYFQLSL